MAGDDPRYEEIEASYDEVNPDEIIDSDKSSMPDEEFGLLVPFVMPKSTTSKERYISEPQKGTIRVVDMPTKYRERAVPDFATGNLDDENFKVAVELWETMSLIQDYGRRNSLDLSPLHNLLHEILLGDITLSKSKSFELLKQFKKTSAEQVSRHENISYSPEGRKSRSWSIVPDKR